MIQKHCWVRLLLAWTEEVQPQSVIRSHLMANWQTAMRLLLLRVEWQAAPMAEEVVQVVRYQQEVSTGVVLVVLAKALVQVCEQTA